MHKLSLTTKTRVYLGFAFSDICYLIPATDTIKLLQNFHRSKFLQQVQISSLKYFAKSFFYSINFIQSRQCQLSSQKRVLISLLQLDHPLWGVTQGCDYTKVHIKKTTKLKHCPISVNCFYEVMSSRRQAVIPEMAMSCTHTLFFQVLVENLGNFFSEQSSRI